MPQPGELLGGRYRLDDRIAAGGMGEVWRASDMVLGRPVAVKTLLAGYAGDAGFRSRFQHEARAMASLRHASVVPVYDFGDTGEGAAYLVMARVDGQPLDKKIAERGPLSPADTMSIVAQAARALAAAHEAGIVHRDVKPGNLIIEPDGTVVLVDFGVARSANSLTLTGAKEVVGTALYIAPEQVSKQTTGPPADIYALGAVAYHCLAGKPPFLGDNPLAVALQHVSEEPAPLPGNVPDSVRELVATAMAKDPNNRFASASAMADTASNLLLSDADAAPDPEETSVLPVGAVAAALEEPAPNVTKTTAWVMPDEPPPPVETPPAGGNRRNLVLLSIMLLALISAGILIAVANPFGSSPKDAPASTPGNQAPLSEPSATKNGKGTKNNTGNDGKVAATSDNDEKQETSPRPAARPSQRSTAPAAPATTEPETTTETTAPATEAPATATTEPETTTAPTGGSEEGDDSGEESEQETEDTA
ncbi:serine/threonine-protein kinase [Actinoplanes lutulentus]|uniref:non-specific serine/threonine protein kinase n=1 Tax=Actinoplanes lutulentus TaxID=1287878 RepID=A0A327ZEV9_9ACTN|nr:serine/threonine-protein kinase [Actinoplanes lutulentus]MBB2942952.1 serine/threonine-protein kinase [Actinoplanes lutulentus]RAK38530.1 serine/threonine-protein kinase [Actinoplanes lutulentus]